MGKKKHLAVPVVAPPSERQRAIAGLRIGDRATLAAEVEWTSAGLLSAAALVSSILLSSALIVLVATRRSGSG